MNWKAIVDEIPEAIFILTEFPFQIKFQNRFGSKLFFKKVPNEITFDLLQKQFPTLC